MTDFYRNLCEKSNMPRDAVECALGFSEKLDVPLLRELFFDGGEKYSVTEKGVLSFKEAFFPCRFFSVLSKKLAELRISYETGFLYAYLLLAPWGFDDHKARGLDENIYFDTLSTIANASKEHFANTGVCGIYDYHFLSNHTRGNILRLGSFEYVLADYEDKPAIIMHVPCGADFEKKARLHSYDLARRCFGNSRPIIADTWLLYDKLSDMLPENSNIRSFKDDFRHIEQNAESHDYGELFHIFGRLPDFSYENLPQNTTLQKAYAQRVKNNLPIGSGVGELSRFL